MFAIQPSAAEKSGVSHEATPFFQPKLTVNTPGDEYEQEADAVADQVMRMPDFMPSAGKQEGESPLIQNMPLTPLNGVMRMCSKCAENEEEQHDVHRKESGGSDASGKAAPSIVSDVLSSGGGQAMDGGTRQFMESRFGQDFSSVRIHTGSRAAESAGAIQARAYTSGKDVVFGAGQYQPGNEGGKRLLAHELAHVGQQGEAAIRRCTNKSDEAKYDALVTQTKKIKAYTDLDAGDNAKAAAIITEGKAKPDCLYYAQKLKILFETPVVAGEKIASDHRARTSDAVKEEDERIKGSDPKELDAEERATADPTPEKPAENPAKGPAESPATKPAPKPGRKWIKIPGKFGGGTYSLDKTDLTNILVKVKIHLVPTGAGTYGDVDQIKKLEDGIEDHASRKGFTLNLEFVNPTNKPDFVADAETFTVTVNPTGWPVATNWAGGDARTYAHELYHMLAFELDKYNYIENQSTNKKMQIPDRLHWFLEQMRKPKGYDNPESLIGSGQYPTEVDVCEIAKVDMATCLKARENLASTKPRQGTHFGFSFGLGGYGGDQIGGYLSAGLGLGIPVDKLHRAHLDLSAKGTILLGVDPNSQISFLYGLRAGLRGQISRFELGGFAGAGFGYGLKGQTLSGISDPRLPTGSTGYLEAGASVGYKPEDHISLRLEGGTTSIMGSGSERRLFFLGLQLGVDY